MKGKPEKMRLPAVILSIWLSLGTASAQGLEGLLGGSSPKVTLDYGTFQGTTKYRGGQVNSFLGVPFATAGRLENPKVVSKANKLRGIQDATRYGDACPQQELIASPLNGDNAAIGADLSTVEQIAFPKILRQSEDCLNLNVQVPKCTRPGAKLPVMMWIHGGGFELGSSAALGSEQTALPGMIYQGANLVSRSIEMKRPMIFVSANHRLNAFGTLASQEITDAGVGNLLLKDQRIAMRWIQRYISKFGGDPTKVTLFGESAGSMAIADHMLLNDGNTEGLFRGAIMASGGPGKMKDYHHAQHYFDEIATATGCGTALDKIKCLRKAPYAKLYNAVQQQPNFFSYESTVVPWYPRADGTYLKDSPHRLLRSGKAANIPYIIGDMKDEGTLFSLVTQANVTTDAGFKEWLKGNFFQSATAKEINALAAQYPSDLRQGSPFDTGLQNAISPMYKRIAAFVGDYTFQSGRRDLLNHTPANRKWTYLMEQSIPLLGRAGQLGGLAGLPLLGSFHVSDVALTDFGTIPSALSSNTRDVMSTFIAFVDTLDPNNRGLSDLPKWPQWDPQGKKMFRYKESGADIIKDTFREAAMSFVNDNAETYLF